MYKSGIDERNESGIDEESGTDKHDTERSCAK